ncbi:hypothetical protein PSA7680_01643 [Pseudoruegeria aquimaris]|uniref:Uncharacterized protein n=1 Tax=Pseudoruegeria aquimaris TaxID=393663 RepID=A0A1Y5SAR1_9RHOB|nr:hypothetical protein PSA7680_01643 [Pseudoruegeria aquimaris]
MTPLNPIRKVPAPAGYGAGDVLVVFGEVFGRGYVNGLIDAAEKAGMTVLYGTVGRRDAEGNLRPLTDAELAEKGHGPIINVPLEAGFDKEKGSDGLTLSDRLNALGKDWENGSLDMAAIEETRQKGEARFKASVAAFMAALKPHLPEGANVLFAHTMAGGIPASKRVLSVSNRVFKGTGARFQSSETYWNSPIGRACEISFEEVTARTLKHLVEGSAELRAEIEAKGGRVNYVAYGYHGTECLIDGSYQWQTYAPYLQGFAKMKLEDLAAEARATGVNVSVYNAPEILTNSSGVFVGVELPLYRLLNALDHEAESAPLSATVKANCAAKLTDGEAALARVQEILDTYHADPATQYMRVFENWPQHNTQEQMDIMLGSSAELRAMHKDSDDLMTSYLSQLVFTACGHIMLHQSWTADSAAYWMGHDVVSKTLGVTGLPG